MKKSEIYKDSNREYYESNKPSKKLQGQNYYYKNKDKVSKAHAKYYKDNKKRIQQRLVEKYQEYRYKFIQMYGGKCVCCGEDTYEFLTIEHIQGQKGIKKKETSGKAYRSAVKNFNPEKYTILCSNCNHATRYGNMCPHQKRILY